MNTTFDYIVPRDMTEEPVLLAWDAGEVSAVAADGQVFPAASVDGGVLVILTAKKGETLTFTVSDAVCGSCFISVDEEKKTVLLTVGGKASAECVYKAFAEYVYDEAFPKPHLGPVTDEDGHSFTRCDLMHKEHPHQRSIIIAIGDVNGIDCWNEREDCGYVRNEGIFDVVSTAAYGAFTAKNRWTNHDGVPAMTEKTRFVIYNQSDACRVIDVTVTFTADYGDVVFGPTKEAGPLGIRLRDELREDIGKGTLSNSRGGVGEGECWGKEAEWCDYHGNVDSVGEMGVTVYDHPSNERYPTAWHIRSYGLFAANNFHFKGGYTLAAGDSITYKYRVMFRRREMDADEIESRYDGYKTETVAL